MNITPWSMRYSGKHLEMYRSIQKRDILGSRCSTGMRLKLLRGRNPIEGCVSMERFRMKRFMAVLVVTLLMSSSAVMAKTIIRAATANPPGSLHAAGLEKFKELVEMRSGGEMVVRLYLDGQMGSEQKNVKQVGSGQLQVAVMASGNVSPFSPKVGLLTLPYIFPNIEDAYTLFRSDFMDDMADDIAKEGNVRPLAWLVGGYRVLTNSKQPITKLADLQGVNVRVPKVETMLAAYKAWGIEGYPMAWIEVYDGLQQGVIDGQDNPHLVNVDQEFWGVQRYITDLHYMLWTGPIIVSENWFKKLPAYKQALIRQAALDAAEYQWQWVAAKEASALAKCQEMGMEFSELEDEELWIEKAKSIWPQFYDKVGGKAYVDQALSIMNRNR